MFDQKIFTNLFIPLVLISFIYQLLTDNKSIFTKNNRVINFIRKSIEVGNHVSIIDMILIN